MLHRIYISITLDDTDDVCLYLDADIPARLCVNEAVSIDQFGWVKFVETTIYSLFFKRYETELKVDESANEEGRTITKNALVNEGWTLLP